MRRAAWWIAVVVLGAALLGLGALIVRRLPDGEPVARGRGGPGAAPVEVAEIGRGAIENRRMFSGALEATSRVTLAPKVAGRVVRLAVDVADRVERGQVVAVLDSAEYEQAVMQAEAELAVARAMLTQAESAAEIAARELARVRTLQERGVASESSLDTVIAEDLAKRATIEVARAEVTRSEAALEAAKIRLGYTTIHAEWSEGDDTRVVAERFVEEGDTVPANAALVSIIELNPIEAVVYVAERDYGLLHAGQAVTLTTDAHPGRTWEGEVTRQRDLLQAQISEVEAVIGYRIALVELYLAEGSLLERRGMRIDGASLGS